MATPKSKNELILAQMPASPGGALPRNYGTPDNQPRPLPPMSAAEKPAASTMQLTSRGLNCIAAAVWLSILALSLTMTYAAWLYVPDQQVVYKPVEVLMVKKVFSAVKVRPEAADIVEAFARANDRIPPLNSAPIRQR